MIPCSIALGDVLRRLEAHLPPYRIVHYRTHVPFTGTIDMTVYGDNQCTCGVKVQSWTDAIQFHKE